MVQPVSPVGYVGGGEPARRFQQAAVDLGIELVVLTPDPPQPSEAIGEASSPFAADTLGELIARSAVITLGHGCDHRTYAALIEAGGPTLRPNRSTIRVAHEPLAARYVLQDCMVDFAEFEEIDSGDTEAVVRFAQHHGWPVRLSTARWGTTAPHVHLVRPYSVLDEMWAATIGQLWLLEASEPLAPQLAVVIARRPSGQQIVCSVNATNVKDCQQGRPPPVTASFRERAIETATSIVDELGATGIVTVTFLRSHDGRLLVDDVTYGPEPHPVAGAVTDHSLYAIHLCAILDWPLDPAPTTDPDRRNLLESAEADAATSSSAESPPPSAFDKSQLPSRS